MANEFKIKNGLIVSGSAEVEQNLTVRGILTADEYHVSVITSSVLYESGSTRFGDSIDDNHDFTGSVNITGSITLNGQAIGTGKLDEATFNSFTQSYVTDSGSIDTRLDNLESFSSSLDSAFITETEFGSFTGSINSYTSSANGRLNALETASSSLNSFTSSINTTIKSKLDAESVISGSVQIKENLPSGTISGSIQVEITGTTGYSTFSGSISSSIGSLSSSIASTDSGQDSRLTSIENKTGSYATTGSNLFIGNQTHSGSILPAVDNFYDLGSPTHQWKDVYISSGSLYIDGTKVIGSTTQELTITTDTGQSIKILEAGTDSIVLQTADGDIELKSSGGGDILLDPTSGIISIKGTTQIQDGYKITSSGGTNIVFGDGIIVSGSIELTGTVDGIDLQSFSSSVASKLDNLNSTSNSLNSYTSSTDGRLSSIETATSSLNSFTSSINTTIKSKLNSDNVVSGSIQIVELGFLQTGTFNTMSSSIHNRVAYLEGNDYTQGQSINSLVSKTGSYATTGSNTFVGSQTISGSVIITQNLQVFGSSSITYVTASQLAVSSSVISVNVFEPAERFGGIKVFDSGSSAATASLLWDSLNNKWIYQNDSGVGYSGGMLLSGPRNTGSLGQEVGLTSGKIARSAGGDHLNDSIITEYSGTTIGISGSLIITGSILSTDTPLVSGSAQISFNGITDKPTLVSGSAQVISLLPAGTVSGSSQVLNGSGVWSGSAQLPAGTVSGSSQISYGSITGVPSGIVSGSSQITFGSITGVPGGLVSGSSQIDLASTTNYSSGIKTRLNAEGVISGSSQVLSGTGIWSGSAQLPSGTVSGSSQVLNGTTIHSGSFFNGITVVSGSAQISFSGIAGVPSGLVSGSSQIAFGSITGVPSGLVSGSSQVLSGTGIWSGSAQLPSGVVSGSSQISYGSISGVPSGLVSGSSQITLSSTTGFGSYLNQAVLTSSSPSFAGLTTTGLLTMSRSAGATGLDMATNDNYASMRVIANQVTSGVNADGMYIGYQNGNSGVTRIFGGGATSGGIAVNGSGVNNVTIAGNIVLNASNYTSYAMQGAGYSANQNLNTTSSPTFDSPYFSGAVSHNTSSSRNKYNVYGSGGTYCIGMQSGIGYGGLSDWGMTFQFNNDNARGFWWGDDGHSVNQGAMALTTHGYLTLARGARIGYGESDTATPTLPLQVYGSGGVVVDIQGSSGQLFSVTDDLTGDIFSVSDISGMPLINVNATTGTGFGYTAFPLVNNLYDLGTSALRWANVYTNDLHLSNEGKNGGNDIDGTTGDWTIQEGAEQLYIINNKNGKKFKINLTEIE